MITFDTYIANNLFAAGNMTMVQARCKYLPECFKTPVRVNINELGDYKIKVEKQVLFMLAERMLSQRLQNYNHSGTEDNYQLKILQDAREKLENIKNSNYEYFLQEYKSKIIRVFHIIMPPFESKFHENFSQKVTDIENYLKAKK